MHEAWRDRLKTAGMRVTAPRMAVLEALRQTGPHASAEAVAAQARTGAKLSTQSIYDNLNALVAIGLVRRIEPAGHPARYELRVADNHHHMVCRSCGRTEDVDCALGEAPCLQASESHGFHIDEAEVIYWGLCPSCQNVKREDRRTG